MHACMEGVHGATARGNVGRGKVVVVMGATATGKSKLAVDLALRFRGEVVNSDKIQVHDGLAVVTNKVTARERAGVPHHLIGGVHPDADYAAADYRRDATRAVESVLARGSVPILAGGSNSYLEALLDGEPAFRRRYELCFLWVDADLPVLDRYARGRIDCMLDQGLVAEVRALFRPDADYSRGIRRSIGVPEMDAYFRREAAAGAMDGDDEQRARLLAAAVEEIKANTCRLARRQLRKIHRLRGLPGWTIRRLDATRVLALKVGGVKDDAAERAAWEADVVVPAACAVDMFLADGGEDEEEKVMAAKQLAVIGMAGAGVGAAAEWCGLQTATTSTRFHGRKAAAAVCGASSLRSRIPLEQLATI